MSQPPTNPIPFSEPPYLCGLPSPYYTASHRRFQKACRDFMWEHLLRHALEYERAGEVPEHVYTTFCKHNMLLPNMGAPLPVEWLHRLGIYDILGVKVEEWDYMYSGIYFDELARSGLAGPGSSLNAGFTFAIPPILKYASPEFQERFLPELLTGQKRCCIAITEPEAGSDVANITTTATKTADGKYYIVNGTKKWITNGIWSSYATMAVRTGPPGAAGLSVLLVPLQNQPGVSMRRLHVSGQLTSGTTYITLEDVHVPVTNLIGPENHGMQIIMKNFNHERLSIAVGVTRSARVALSTAFAYCLRREAFGKALMEQAVVRHRLAKAGAELETMWAFLEQLLYQLCHLEKEEADRRLGAEVPGARIPGGSEDVLLDLAVRQLVKIYTRGEGEKARM
ncbi:putative acyl-CoA dehydrogenase [Aspergillus heteromorphus CBS 117.55]|uniref:Putative acyl-CoA dehydrogenase n=1 Tax=Aspergillus heteromorphus CBS 117.55 TaxID=1448321 RepID=A0A317UYQ2_9EURO|nr:putative acyl-CoA dehydrogenase [Aspergillus heteromorphus CBS 117.55]PWY66726.1 putative acyl-CoA dehydrogenase [Aspergillus heteromorphus CBS 117.55]